MRTLSAVACWLLLQSVSSQTTNTTQSPMLNTRNCQQGNGAYYRGTTSVTETNRTCQRWDSQTPHHHQYTPVNYPLAGLENNYCRNPGGWHEIWCYTTDPGERWERCDVPLEIAVPTLIPRSAARACPPVSHAAAARAYHPGGEFWMTVRLCDKRLTGDDGTFTSPNYPNLYPNGNECRYEISVTPPKVVRLTFTDFNLEERSDFLYVYDGNTTDEAWEIKRLHGENIPSPITSTRSIMTVRFTSNLSGNLKGFQANYTAVEKVGPSPPADRISDPAFGRYGIHRAVGQFLCDDGVTCIKAWERCDGNNDCRDGEDEDANTCACQDIPESLRMCSDLEYNKMTLANPLNSAYTTVDDIARSNQFNAYRNLAESGCHPRIKDYICAIIAPRCNSSFSPNPRQMLPCRSWCEEVKYSCKHQPTWSIFPTCDMFHYNNCNNVRPSRTQTGVECFNGNGANYRGDEYRDPIGEGDCNRWDADIHPKKYPWSNLVDNKCRNPPVSARDIRPWCFTSSGFEYCDIMPCNTSIKGCKDPGKPLFGKRNPVLKFYWPYNRITYTCDTGFKFPKGSPPNTARCVQVNESTGEFDWATQKPKCVVDHKYKLQKDLLSETVYNVEVAPTTNLYIKAYVVNIINLDEKAEQIVTSYKAEWTWKDDRLTWDPERYGDFDHVFVSDELVWQPTLTLERNADTRYSGDFPNTEVRIDNDGEVTWPIAALASTTCTLDPFLFPQDNMTCAICWTVGEDYTIGCANQTTHHDTKVKNKNFLTCLNPEADIVTGEWTGKTTASSSNNEACLTITLKRDPTYHYSTTISPCLILIVLMIITFIMPIDKGDRIGFGVTVLLSMVVSLVVVTGFLPVSSTLPFIAMLIIVCMGLMALFMLWTVFILIIHDKKGPLPKWARTFFLKHMARAVFLGDLTKKLKNEEPTGEAVKNQVNDIEGHSNHAFKMDNGPTAGQVNPPPNVKNEVGATLIRLNGSVDKLDATVSQLSRSIDALAKACGADDDEEKSEYALLAHVLDRMGLVFYIVAVAVAIPCTLFVGRKRVVPT
ncbi:hypothetical protein Bbelb_101400 [Branchiostoma belcheri]|nr:hypothetical protein Bbelb_101400 [Branchiostoma belcheri]